MAFASQPTSHSCAHLHRPKVVALKSPTSRTSQSTWNPLKLTGMGTVSARPRDFVSAGSVAACQTTKRFHEISGLISKVLCHHRPILEDPCRSLFVPLDSYYVKCLSSRYFHMDANDCYIHTYRKIPVFKDHRHDMICIQPRKMHGHLSRTTCPTWFPLWKHSP